MQQLQRLRPVHDLFVVDRYQIDMESIVVKIIKGRETWEVTGSPETTFGDLRKEAEARSGAVEGGLRLLHKGRSLDDSTTLEAAKVSTGTKMMALTTAKQREADARIEKTAKSVRDSVALDGMRELSAEKSAGSPSNAVPSPATVRGDAAVSGQTSVMLKKGRETFRANVSLSATVAQLKAHAAGLDGVDAQARDMKLLHKGRFLKDETLLQDCGVCDGATMLLMFGGRHHDKGDARIEMDGVEKEVGELERKVQGVAAKARGRLLDSTDLALAKGEVFEIFGRLKDNVGSVRGEDERRKVLEERLRQVGLELEKL